MPNKELLIAGGLIGGLYLLSKRETKSAGSGGASGGGSATIINRESPPENREFAFGIPPIPTTSIIVPEADAVVGDGSLRPPGGGGAGNPPPTTGRPQIPTGPIIYPVAPAPAPAIFEPEPPAPVPDNLIPDIFIPDLEDVDPNETNPIITVPPTFNPENDPNIVGPEGVDYIITTPEPTVTIFEPEPPSPIPPSLIPDIFDPSIEDVTTPNPYIPTSANSNAAPIYNPENDPNVVGPYEAPEPLEKPVVNIAPPAIFEPAPPSPVPPNLISPFAGFSEEGYVDENPYIPVRPTINPENDPNIVGPYQANRPYTNQQPTNNSPIPNPIIPEIQVEEKPTFKPSPFLEYDPENDPNIVGPYQGGDTQKPTSIRPPDFAGLNNGLTPEEQEELDYGLF